jgi:hypothetical protein
MKTVEIPEGRYYEIGGDGRPDGFRKLQLVLVDGAAVYLCLLERKHDLEDRDDTNRYRVTTGIIVQLQELTDAITGLHEDKKKEAGSE